MERKEKIDLNCNVVTVSQVLDLYYPHLPAIPSRPRLAPRTQPLVERDEHRRGWH